MDAHRFFGGGGSDGDGSGVPNTSCGVLGGNIFALGIENGLDDVEHSSRERLRPRLSIGDGVKIRLVQFNKLFRIISQTRVHCS